MRQFGTGTAMGLTLFLGCTNQSAQTEPVKTVLAAPAIAAPVVPAPAAPAVEQRVAPAVAPENLKITPGLAEIIKLAQAGVTEEVMLAYISNSEQRFTLGPDEIVYLNDLGVTSPVITAMIQRDGKLAAAKPAVAQPHVVSNVPAPAPAPAAPPVATTQVVTTTYVAPPVQETSVSYFHDSLSPYGTWVNVSGVGMCWQPTVAVASAEWRPYSDRGRWLWSDSGWYWQSDYSWGWAAFHYGRWHRHDRMGWVWRPDTHWGPAWVSWRYTSTHCGWAPLPPAAHYVSGVGFRYQERSVGVSFDFGLTDFHYTFIGLGLFCDYNPRRHYEPRHRVTNVYKNSTVINNYVVGNNNTIINNGVGRDTVVKVSQTPVRTVAIRETPVSETGTARTRIKPERMEKEGASLVVYRPQLPKTPPATLASSTAGKYESPAQLRSKAENPQAPGLSLAAPAPADTAKPAPLADPAKPAPLANVAGGPKTGVASIIMRGNNSAPTPQTTAATPAPGKYESPAQLRYKAENPSVRLPAIANPAPLRNNPPAGKPVVTSIPQPNPTTIAKAAPPVVAAPAPADTAKPAPLGDPAKPAPLANVAGGPKTGVASIIMRGNNSAPTPQTTAATPAPGKYESPAQLRYKAENPSVRLPAIANPVPVRTESPARGFYGQPQPKGQYESPAQKLSKGQNPEMFEHRPAPQQPVRRAAPGGQPAPQDSSNPQGRAGNSSGNGKNDRNK